MTTQAAPSGAVTTSRVFGPDSRMTRAKLVAAGAVGIDDGSRVGEARQRRGVGRLEGAGLVAQGRGDVRVEQQARGGRVGLAGLSGLHPGECGLGGTGVGREVRLDRRGGQVDAPAPVLGDRPPRDGLARREHAGHRIEPRLERDVGDHGPVRVHRLHHRAAVDGEVGVGRPPGRERDELGRAGAASRAKLSVGVTGDLGGEEALDGLPRLLPPAVRWGRPSSPT